jgi:hypothetical protein
MLTDSDSEGQGLYSENKDKCKNKDTSLRYKNIEEHAYLGSQSKF